MKMIDYKQIVMMMMITMKMVMDLCPLDNDTVKIGRGVDGKLA